MFWTLLMLPANTWISASQPNSWKVVLWARGSPQVIGTLLSHKNSTIWPLEPFLSSAGRVWEHRMEQEENFLTFHLSGGTGLGLGWGRRQRREKAKAGAPEMSLILWLQAFRYRDWVHSNQLWIKNNLAIRKFLISISSTSHQKVKAWFEKWKGN